jgi:isoleucyl-tRNA synthetase
MMAPFVPFLAETVWQNLARVPWGDHTVESVHLCDYPTGEPSRADRSLSEQMALVREITSLGRSARMEAKLKVRQPLARVEIILADGSHRQWLRDHTRLISEELNVKEVEFTDHAEQYIEYRVLPDFKRLGPRLGKQLPAVKKLLEATNPSALVAKLRADGHIQLELPDGPVTLDREEIEVRLTARPGWAAAQGARCVVVLSTQLTAELVEEGLARELARAVNDLRKDRGCQFTDRIHLGVTSPSGELMSAVRRFEEFIKQETLASLLRTEPLAGVEPAERDVAGHVVHVYLAVDRPAP